MSAGSVQNFSSCHDASDANKIFRDLPFALEDIEKVRKGKLTPQGLNDWKNIPEVLRAGFMGVFENILAQQDQIDEILKAREFNQQQELAYLREELEKKADLEEVKQSLDHIAEVVDKKAFQEDFQEFYNQMDGI